jgi:O-antigen ligase
MLHHWNTVRRGVAVGLVSMIVIAPFVILNAQFFGVRFNAGGSFQQASFENQSLGERMLLIRSGNQIFAEHSATGIGLGASPLAMKKQFPDFQTNYQPPHYTLLAAAMETGTIGAVFYFLLMITPVIVFAQKWKLFAAQPTILSAFALLLTVTVVGFFDYYTWLNAAGRIWQWLAWGLWSSELAKVA